VFEVNGFDRKVKGPTCKAGINLFEGSHGPGSPLFREVIPLPERRYAQRITTAWAHTRNGGVVSSETRCFK
jgi:hypothetical protein